MPGELIILDVMLGATTDSLCVLLNSTVLRGSLLLGYVYEVMIIAYTQCIRCDLLLQT